MQKEAQSHHFKKNLKAGYPKALPQPNKFVNFDLSKVHALVGGTVECRWTWLNIVRVATISEGSGGVIDMK